MAGSPLWKVYIEDEYIASAKDPFYAAMIIAGMGKGEIRIGHNKKNTCWREGQEQKPASESYDFVSDTCYSRLREHNRQCREAQGG